MSGQGGRLMPVDQYLGIHYGLKLAGGLSRTGDYWFEAVERPRKFGRFSQVLADEWGASRRALLSDVAAAEEGLEELYRKSN